MKTSFFTLTKSEKFELLLATIVLISGIADASPIIIDEEGVQVEDRPAYYFQLFRLFTLYGLFLLNNFKTIPQLLGRKQIGLNLILLTASIASVFLLYKDANVLTAVFIIFGLYQLVKYAIIFLHKSDAKLRRQYSVVAPYTLLIASLYVVILGLLFLGEAEAPLVVFAILSGLFSLGFYLYSYQVLLPKAYSKKKPLLNYIGQSLLLLLISIIPVGLLAAVLLYDAEISVPIVLFNGLLQLLVIVPFSWEVYKREVRSKQAFTRLKKEADQSAANVQMLRSQINPHFLFNILNTLYGTAIQEGAERTAEGVQMLGDMMRFMLHENLKEKIPLTRELEYIRNYIHLQSLRINQSPTVAIKTELEDYQGEATIAPMLLIPFIENAFKHGISLRDASFIIVILKVDNRQVRLEVSNSTHPKPVNDTEAGKSGIGLDNVKQRLALSYPNSHRIAIQEALGKHKVKLEIDLRNNG